MNIKVKFNSPKSPWTYGCEHEFGDWDRRVHLPKGFGVDRKDYTVMNSNGIAADPKGVLYQYGGEINTPPSLTASGQVKHLRDIKALFPEATINHRSNLHVHIRVPGLIGDLAALKQIAVFNHRYLPSVLPIIEPIPEPVSVKCVRCGIGLWKPTQKELEQDQCPGCGIVDPEVTDQPPEEYKGAVRRARRRTASHHTVITDARLKEQLEAETVLEFFKSECPAKAGVTLWHLAPRHAVNLRHMREDTETIEFRHFPGTLDEQELFAAVRWCEEWLSLALGKTDGSPIDLANSYRDILPKFPPYVHWREIRYRQTCHDGTVSKADITKNIERICAEGSQA